MKTRASQRDDIVRLAKLKKNGNRSMNMALPNIHQIRIKEKSRKQKEQQMRSKSIGFASQYLDGID